MTGISARDKAWLKWVISLAVWANLIILMAQLMLQGGPDRGVGLLGNDRASNTLALFTLFGSLGMLYGQVFNIRVTGPTFLVAAVTAWLGDAILSLAAATILAVGISANTLLCRTHSTREGSKDGSRSRAVAPVLILTMCFILAAQAVGTQSAIPLTLGPYSPVIEHASDRLGLAASKSEVSQDLCCVAWTPNVLVGSGPGSADSLTGQLIREGRYALLEQYGSAVQRGQSATERDSGPVGTAYSNTKTLLGLISELGWIGFLSFIGLFFATLGGSKSMRGGV